MTGSVKLRDEDRRAIRNRLSRARGQLDAIIRQIEEDQACLEVLPQMIAASKAVDRATYAMVLSAIESCSTEPSDHPDSIELKKIFLSLA
ncbi:MAG: metal-sensitive transcriptional regulator [Actinomycetaceae bacterium]|nr:metal-sensitive transcriptional regulator [Actinomycetaceae bacterium]